MIEGCRWNWGLIYFHESEKATLIATHPTPHLLLLILVLAESHAIRSLDLPRLTPFHSTCCSPSVVVCCLSYQNTLIIAHCMSVYLSVALSILQCKWRRTGQNHMHVINSWASRILSFCPLEQHHQRDWSAKAKWSGATGQMTCGRNDHRRRGWSTEYFVVCSATR